MYILHPEGSLHPLYTEGIYILTQVTSSLQHMGQLQSLSHRPLCMHVQQLHLHRKLGEIAYNVIGILV